MIDISFVQVDDALLEPGCKANSKKCITRYFDHI